MNINNTNGTDFGGEDETAPRQQKEAKTIHHIYAFIYLFIYLFNIQNIKCMI